MGAMGRVLYVDGFNFYRGVTAYWSSQNGLAGLGWCNFRALIERHFPGDGDLCVKYFTAPIHPHLERPQSRRGETERYKKWMRALRTIERVIVIEGFHKPPSEKRGREEKQTDVNLAVEMLVDAFRPIESRPKHVFVLSGDCDLMPAIYTLQERSSPPIPVTMLLPSDATKQNWDDRYKTTRDTLRKCHIASVPAKLHGLPGHPIPRTERLTEEILANSLLGYFLRDSEGEFDCPPYWRLQAEYLKEHCRKREWRPDVIRR
jgi:NYN domain-containing protein